jgi:hypothetical protein
LLRRAAALPGRLVAELKRFRAVLKQGEDPAANFTTWGWRFFSVLMLVLVLAQTAMPTAVYAKGFGHSHGHYVPPPAGGTYFGGSVYPMQPRGAFVSGGPGTVISPYYYWYSDPFFHYYYCLCNGCYYYTRVPR